MWSLKGVNCWENFGGKNSFLLFYANVPSLNKLIGYVNFTDCLEMWSKDSQDTIPCGVIPFLKMDAKTLLKINITDNL